MAMTPALRAKAWENTNETQRVIVEALSASGSATGDAVVAAGACLGAVMAALLEWGAEQRKRRSLGESASRRWTDRPAATPRCSRQTDADPPNRGDDS